MNILAVDKIVTVIIRAIAAVLSGCTATSRVAATSWVVAVDECVVVVVDVVIADLAATAVGSCSTEWIITINETVEVVIIVIVTNLESTPRLSGALLIGAIDLAIAVIIDAVVTNLRNAIGARTVIAVIDTRREQ